MKNINLLAITGISLILGGCVSLFTPANPTPIDEVISNDPGFRKEAERVCTNNPKDFNNPQSTNYVLCSGLKKVHDQERKTKK